MLVGKRHAYVCTGKERGKSWRSLCKSFSIYPPFTFPFPKCFWSVTQIVLTNNFPLFCPKMEFVPYFQCFRTVKGPVFTYTYIPYPSLFCFMVLPTLRIDSCGPCSFGSATGHLWLFLLSLGHRDTFLQGPHAAGHAKDYGAALFSSLSKHAQRYHRANQIVLQHRPIQRPHQKPESSTSSVRLLHQPSHPAVPHFLLPPSYV